MKNPHYESLGRRMREYHRNHPWRLSDAYFSDRGRLIQADRGRQISVAVAALKKRAGTGVTVAQSSTISLKWPVVV